MLTFVKNDKGRAEAMEGFHDDLVMALAIAHFISSQQTSSWIEVKTEKPSFIQENFHMETKTENTFMDWQQGGGNAYITQGTRANKKDA